MQTALKPGIVGLANPLRKCLQNGVLTFKSKTAGMITPQQFKIRSTLFLNIDQIITPKRFMKFLSGSAFKSCPLIQGQLEVIFLTTERIILAYWQVQSIYH